MVRLLGFIVPNMMSRLISFFMFPIITFYISPSDYGILSVSIAISGALTAVSTLSVNNYIFKSLKVHGLGSGKNDIKQSYSVTLLITFLIVILLLLFLFMFSHINKMTIMISSLLLLLVIDFYFVAYYRDFYRATNQVKHFAIADLIKVILYPTSMIVGLAYFGWGIYSVLLGNIMAVIAAMIYNMRTEGSLLAKLKVKEFNKYRKELKAVYLYTVPFVVYAITQMILTGFDRIFISYKLSAHDAGIYATAFTMASILGLFANAINNSLIGVFMKTSDPSPIQKAIHLYTISILFMCFTIAICASNFIKVFLHSSYWEATPFISLLLVGQLFYSLHFISLNVLGILTFKTKIIPLTNLIAMITNVLLNLILVPRYGLQAAAFTSAISFGLLFLISNRLSAKSYKFTVFNSKILIYLISFSIVYYLCELFIGSSTIVSFVSRTLIIMATLLTVIWIEKPEQFIKKASVTAAEG